MKRTSTALALGLAASLALVGCVPEPDTAPSSQAPLPPETPASTETQEPPSAPSVRVLNEVVNEVSIPWGIDFFENGDALISLRNSAELLRVTKEGEVTRLGEVPAVARDTSEGGLLGVALDPEDEQIAYVYFTTATDNRVARVSLSQVANVTPIVTGIERATNHNGGQLLFDDEGTLFIATGDAAQTHLSQDRDSLNGKILRVKKDGSAADGNPFNNRVYSYGHRNVQGLAFDSAGQLWATEFGQETTDELNRIEAGGNYGWPDVEGEGSRGGFIDPYDSWSPTSTASPSGLEIVDDVAYIGALRGESLFAVPLTVGPETTRLLEGEYGRIRSVAQAPDGALWITTSNTSGWTDPRPGDDRVLRVEISG